MIQVRLSLSDSVPEQYDTRKQLVKISIHNEGNPIPAHHLDKLFDRFYRGQKTNHQVEGSGLGLSIAQQIIQRHNKSCMNMTV